MCIMHTLQEVWAHDDNGECGMLTNTVFPTPPLPSSAAAMQGGRGEESVRPTADDTHTRCIDTGCRFHVVSVKRLKGKMCSIIFGEIVQMQLWLI